MYAALPVSTMICRRTFDHGLGIFIAPLTNDSSCGVRRRQRGRSALPNQNFLFREPVYTACYFRWLWANRFRISSDTRLFLCFAAPGPAGGLTCRAASLPGEFRMVRLARRDQHFGSAPTPPVSRFQIVFFSTSCCVCSDLVFLCGAFKLLLSMPFATYHCARTAHFAGCWSFSMVKISWFYLASMDRFLTHCLGTIPAMRWCALLLSGNIYVGLVFRCGSEALCDLRVFTLTFG